MPVPSFLKPGQQLISLQKGYQRKSISIVGVQKGCSVKIRIEYLDGRVDEYPADPDQRGVSWVGEQYLIYPVRDGAPHSRVPCAYVPFHSVRRIIIEKD